MRNKIILFFYGVLLYSSAIFAQIEAKHSVIEFDFTQRDLLKVKAPFFIIANEGMYVGSENLIEIFESGIIESAIKNARPFLAVGFNVEKAGPEGDLDIEYSYSKDGENWSEWRSCNLEEDGGEGSEGSYRYFSESLGLLNPKMIYIKYKLILRKRDGNFPIIKNVKTTFISPGETPKKLIEENTVPKGEMGSLRKESGVHAYLRPSYVNRAGWGCPQSENSTSRTLTNVTHLVLHHSADSYDPGNPDRDYAAVVRSYWNYHVNTNGWADIGYNWLIDPKGVLYKGRAWYDANNENVLGAHNSSKNGNTSGISIIGNYVTYQPTSASLNMLYEIMAFLCNKYNIAPKGTSYHAALSRDNENVDGHEGSGGGTACPGTNLISKYASIRQAVYDKLNPTVNLLLPENEAVLFTLTPSFSWEDNSAIPTYVLQVSETSAFATNILNKSISSANYIAAPKILSGGKTYYWRVKADYASTWSDVRSFNTEDIKYWSQWVYSDSTENLPEWFGTDTEGGIAYLNNELLVVSRKEGLKVKRLNYTNGVVKDSLKVSGIAGGDIELSNIEVSEDGQILACNLTFNAQSSPFKIYKWSGFSENPEEYIFYNSSPYKLGGAFSVIGNLNGNALIYAAANDTNIVLRWIISEGVLNAVPEEIILTEVLNLGSQVSVAPISANPEDDFYVNGSIITPTLFSSTGLNKGSLSDELVPVESGSIKYFVQDTNKYLLVFQSVNIENDPNGQNLKLINITGGIDNASLAFFTPRLGNFRNDNFSGDVAFRSVTGASNIFFVIATNNGIASYIDGYNSIPTSVEYFLNETPADYALLQNYPNPFNPATTITYKLSKAFDVSLKIYNILGSEIASLVKDAQKEGVYSVVFDASNLASGIYICRLQTGSFAKSIKMSLIK